MNTLEKRKALSDIHVLERALIDRFSYLGVGSVNYRQLFANLRDRLPDQVDVPWFGLQLQKLLANFIDGHMAVNALPNPPGFFPFLTGWAEGSVVAFEPDRSSFLDSERPYLHSVDGVSIKKWLRAAAEYVPSGSPQFVSHNSLRWLRAAQMLRNDLGLPLKATAEVTVVNHAGSDARTLTLELSERPPMFGVWPRTQSSLLDGNLGYLRITSMSSEAAGEIPELMGRFADAVGLIIDVRGNSGGSREALLALLPLLMAPDDAPRVVNVAAYRATEGVPDDYLENRFLYRVDSPVWSAEEREVLERFMPDFTPEWKLPPGEFSGWHAMLASPQLDVAAPRYLDKPVAVLMDSASFSATDILLSALKGMPRVTLVGTPSGGGSARAQVVELTESGLKVRFATMASFQASGELFDGRGVQPDVTVHPSPECYLAGGTDRVLKRGVDVVTGREAG